MSAAGPDVALIEKFLAREMGDLRANFPNVGDLVAMAPSADRSWGFLTRGFSQKTGNLAGLTRQTDTELLRLFFENGMMHTTELAAALDLTEDEICLRM